MNTNANVQRFTDRHVIDGPNIIEWQTFWSRLEREYHAVCREMNADPLTVDLDAFSDELDRLAQAMIPA